jgi:hypothetical protein
MLPEFLKSINHDLVLLVGALMIAGVGYFTAVWNNVRDRSKDTLDGLIEMSDRLREDYMNLHDKQQQQYNDIERMFKQAQATRNYTWTLRNHINRQLPPPPPEPPSIIKDEYDCDYVSTDDKVTIERPGVGADSHQ